MSAHAEIKTALDASAGLAALVGVRIRADLAQEKDAFPFVVFKRTDYLPEYGLDNSVHAVREIFAIECWGETRSQSVDVSEQVLLALADAGLPATNADPDGIDPDVLARATVLNVDVWS